MTKLTWVMLIFCCAGFCGVSRAQSIDQDAAARASSAGSSLNSSHSCESVLESIWHLEHKFEDTQFSETPATDAQALAAEADVIQRHVLGCEWEAHKKNDRLLVDAVIAAWRNLLYIRNTDFMNGGTYSFDPRFHEDLPVVAPACKEVLESKLPEKIVALKKEYESTAHIKEDVTALYEKDAAMVTCATQATNAGYRGAGGLIYSEASLVEDFLVGQLLDENKTLRHANSKLVILLNSMPSHTITVPVESQHCTATLQDLPWGKSIDWDCY